MAPANRDEDDQCECLKPLPVYSVLLRQTDCGHCGKIISWLPEPEVSPPRSE